MDEAQKEHLKKNKQIYEFVNSDGWKHVKTSLLEKIEDLQSIMNIEGTTPEQVVLDIKVRRATMEILIEWLRDVEGQTNQYIGNEFSLEESELLHISREE